MPCVTHGGDAVAPYSVGNKLPTLPNSPTMQIRASDRATVANTASALGVQ